MKRELLVQQRLEQIIHPVNALPQNLIIPDYRNTLREKELTKHFKNVTYDNERS
jgi:hypothetical protein